MAVRNRKLKFTGMGENRMIGERKTVYLKLAILPANSHRKKNFLKLLNNTNYKRKQNRTVLVPKLSL